MHDDAQRLLAIQAKRKRWQSRLTRAVNALNKLDRQLARLGKPRPVKPKGQPKVSTVTEADVKAKPPVSETTDISWREMTGADLSIPENLLRPKQKVTDEEKKRMPLSGRAALDAIKQASAKVTAKRNKKYDEDILDQDIRRKRVRA